MTTLLAPPPSTLPPRSPPRRETSPATLVSSPLAEYIRFFSLDLTSLRGRDVLDVGAGASSFTAEACARKIDAVAVDPRYGSVPATFAVRLQDEQERLAARPRARRSPADAERRLAAERFLADYAVHFAHGRYVGGALARLPFFDGTFDLVLSAHLLFTDPERLDFDWHVAACRELVRVSANEVRLFPLGGPEGRTYARLAALRRELKAAGVASAVRAVDGQFPSDHASMLVLTKAAS